MHLARIYDHGGRSGTVEWCLKQGEADQSIRRQYVAEVDRTLAETASASPDSGGMTEMVGLSTAADGAGA